MDTAEQKPQDLRQGALGLWLLLKAFCAAQIDSARVAAVG